MLRREKGDLGEAAAVKRLKKEGYVIIGRNFDARVGEIDVIAKDGEYTCFVEVRLRKRGAQVSAAESIDRKKRQRIIRAAEVYAQRNGLIDSPLRFDAVIITADEENGKLKDADIEVIKNAFWIQNF